MKERLPSKIGRAIGLIILLFSVFFPFYWILISSFKLESELLSATPTFFPKQPSLNHYRRVLFESDYLRAMLNSAITALSSMAVGLVLSILTAYSFSDFNYKFKKFSEEVLWITSMFPGVLLMIPFYVLMNQLGLLNTLTGLTAVCITLYVPFGVFTMKSFFQSLPISLREAAYIDGASRLQVLTKILLPLAVPGIVTVASWIFILSWSVYVFGTLLINNMKNRTVVVSLADWMGEYYLDWGALTAGSVMVILPVILFFAFMGRGFIKGLTAGGVKG